MNRARTLLVLTLACCAFLAILLDSIDRKRAIKAERDQVRQDIEDVCGDLLLSAKSTWMSRFTVETCKKYVPGPQQGGRR